MSHCYVLLLHCFDLFYSGEESDRRESLKVQRVIQRDPHERFTKEPSRVGLQSESFMLTTLYEKQLVSQQERKRKASHVCTSKYRNTTHAKCTMTKKRSEASFLSQTICFGSESCHLIVIRDRDTCVRRPAACCTICSCLHRSCRSCLCWSSSLRHKGTCSHWSQA